MGIFDAHASLSDSFGVTDVRTPHQSSYTETGGTCLVPFCTFVAPEDLDLIRFEGILFEYPTHFRAPAHGHQGRKDVLRRFASQTRFGGVVVEAVSREMYRTWPWFAGLPEALPRRRGGFCRVLQLVGRHTFSWSYRCLAFRISHWRWVSA